MTLGSITRQFLLVHQERHKEVSAFNSMSRDNVTRQAMLLDTQRTETENESLTNNSNLVNKIKTQNNGSWVEVIVDANSLLQALGLLLHDPLNSGAYHGHTHVKMQG